jgi:hypothetical protein
MTGATLSFAIFWSLVGAGTLFVVMARRFKRRGLP